MFFFKFKRENRARSKNLQVKHVTSGDMLGSLHQLIKVRNGFDGLTTTSEDYDLRRLGAPRLRFTPLKTDLFLEHETLLYPSYGFLGVSI